MHAPQSLTLGWMTMHTAIPATESNVAQVQVVGARVGVKQANPTASRVGMEAPHTAEAHVHACLFRLKHAIAVCSHPWLPNASQAHRNTSAACTQERGAVTGKGR